MPRLAVTALVLALLGAVVGAYRTPDPPEDGRRVAAPAAGSDVGSV